MPKKSVHKLAVKNASESAFSLHSVTGKPRQCTPIDLHLASENLRLEPLTEEPPEEVLQLAYYLLTDFFGLLHRSGLYNRQMPLWEALARIAEIHIERLTEGFIAKIELPIWELRMLDIHGRKLVLVRFLDDSATDLVDSQNSKDALRFLKNAIKTAAKLKSENPGFAGLILGCAWPMPEIIIENVLRLTGNDPVARYQSVLQNIGCSIDLIARQQERYSLVLPSLPERIKSTSSMSSTVQSKPDASSESATA